MKRTTSTRIVIIYIYVRFYPKQKYKRIRFNMFFSFEDFVRYADDRRRDRFSEVKFYF